MKKVFTFLAALLMAGSMMAEVIEIKLTDLKITDYGADRNFDYSNDDYKVTLDIFTSFPWSAGETYHLYNVDPDFSKITDKNTGTKYLFTALEFVFGENFEDIEITATAAHNSETISIHAVYDANPTALENAAASVKATKLVENGQIIILCDGVRYNAIGAKL